jgi:SRSO17 transposase
MATNRVRACARKITCFHQQFEPCFARREAKAHSLVYLQGLILGEGRKNVERIALRFSTARGGGPPSQNEVVALQEFLTLSPWQARSVQEKIQDVFAQELVPSTATWPLGTVGVVDESAFVKSGPESCGVARQWCGRLGKKENCQVGVFLLGVTPAGTALLDHAAESLGRGSVPTPQDACSRGGEVPNQARNRDRANPPHAGGGARCVRLDYGR